MMIGNVDILLVLAEKFFSGPKFLHFGPKLAKNVFLAIILSLAHMICLILHIFITFITFFSYHNYKP